MHLPTLSYLPWNDNYHNSILLERIYVACQIFVSDYKNNISLNAPLLKEFVWIAKNFSLRKSLYIFSSWKLDFKNLCLLAKFDDTTIDVKIYIWRFSQKEELILAHLKTSQSTKYNLVLQTPLQGGNLGF